MTRFLLTEFRRPRYRGVDLGPPQAMRAAGALRKPTITSGTTDGLRPGAPPSKALSRRINET
jgi:hypothetical protein